MVARSLLVLLLVPVTLAVQCSTNATTCATLGCSFFERACPCACNTACESTPLASPLLLADQIAPLCTGARYGDCCTDYKAACPSLSPGPYPGPHPGPPSPAPSHGGGPQGGPEQLHLSLTHSPTSMVVSFATAKTGYAGSTPTCTISGGSKFSGAAHTYTDGGWQGLLHTVTLTGLTPGASYTYSCAVGAAASATHSFTAAPAVGALPVTVAVVGDLGEGCDKAECGNQTIARLVADAGTYGLL
eukprot:1209733-Prymnesium_polylepis.1